MSRLWSIAVFGMMVMAGGCGSSPDDDLVSDGLQVPARPLAGPIGGNGMDPLDFWDTSNQSALRTLGASALRGAGGKLVATPLLDTAAGKSVLEYTMRCALSDGTSVTSAAGDSFAGSIGLATGWTSHGLTTSEQRWVTACLLQHLNGVSAHVALMLDGSHSALDPRPGEDTSDFTVEDSTTFGNVFVSGAGVKGYVCLEADINLLCPLDLSLHTLERVCGLSPTCGMSVLGLCSLVCTNDGNGDPSCRTSLLFGTSYPQAIRSTIRDTDVLSLYPGCDLL